MSSISEAFEASARVDKPEPARPASAVASGTRAKASAAVGDVARAVKADVVGAWPWRGKPPTLADLWKTRIPDIENVPAANRALWIGWLVFNHLALVWTAVLATALWVLQHPARTALAAAVAAPIIAIWLT